jgi:curved DNA-binding protein CbpA
MDPSSRSDPFSALGLPAQPGITDDEVRAAWRRIAAASHPDRADGGNPGRFAAAAAAYTLLRTPFGRSEALADLAGSRGAGRRGRQPGRLLTRAWRGRPALLALRLAIVAAVCATVIAVAGAAPATPALITGAVTWLLLTARHDLAPPP